jgi:hypothetical protein
VALSDTWLKANNGKQMLKWGVKREIISVNPLTVESRVQLSQCSRRILSHRFKEEFA